MTKAYQYDASGYFAGEVEDYGLLPNNATSTAPQEREGFIPRWTGEAWEQVEDHKGREGYVDGKPHTVKEYGPLPDGWSDTPPEPTEAELCAVRIAEIKGELQSIDTAKVRPMSAIIQGTATDDEHTRLTELNAQADALRAEMQMLEAFI